MNVTDLVEGCIHHRKKAQNRLYDMYSSRLYGVCLRYSGDRAEAQDILQESFLKIYKNIHTLKFTNEISFYGWMHRITVNTALNHCRDYLKKHQLHETLEFANTETEFNETSVYEDILEHISHEKLLKLIQELPTGYRTIFNLYAFENNTHKEIATALEISVNTSKSQLFKARKMLASRIYKILATNNVKMVI